jgi:MFS family permease
LFNVSVPRNIRLLTWFNFWGDFRLYAPIAILYFSQVSGSYALGMSVWSIAKLSQSLFEVPTGVFSDMIGRKRTMTCGAAASALSLIFYAIGGSYPALVIGGIFEGLAFSFFSGNNEAFLYDTLAETDHTDAFQEYMGKTSSGFQFALGISAMLGSLIAAVSFQLVMWLSVIPMVVALFISLQMTEPRVHSHTSTNIYAHLREAFRNIVRNPRLRVISGASILSFAIGESAWLFRSAFIETLWPVWALGVAQMIGNLTAAVSYFFAGRLIRRFGEFRLLVGGMSISETTNLFALAFPSVLSPLIMSLNSVFYGVNMVAKGGLMQREFTDEQRATMGSLTSFGGSLVFVGFSVLLGALADQTSPVFALVTASLLSVLPMSLYWWGLHDDSRTKQNVVRPDTGSL